MARSQLGLQIDRKLSHLIQKYRSPSAMASKPSGIVPLR